MTFDKSGRFAESFHCQHANKVSMLFCSRLITCEADKSIKIWKENDEATEVTHPVDIESWTKQCLQLKRH